MDRRVRRRLGEVEGQVLGERFDGGLGRVVCGVAGRVGDALLGACDDDACGRGRRGRDERQERVEAAVGGGLVCVVRRHGRGGTY